MSLWAYVIRRLRCWFRWCPGYVVSGTHDNRVWIGWRCRTCGKVKYYAPSEIEKCLTSKS